MFVSWIHTGIWPSAALLTREAALAYIPSVTLAKTEETLTAGTQRLLKTGIRSWLLLAWLIQEERLDKNLKEKSKHSNLLHGF